MHLGKSLSGAFSIVYFSGVLSILPSQQWLLSVKHRPWLTAISLNALALHNTDFRQLEKP